MKTCLAVTLLLSLAAAGCGKPAFADVEPTPFEGTTYTDPVHGFKLRVPFDWESHQPGLGPAVMFMSPSESRDDAFQENVNVVVSPLPRPMTTEECFASAVDAMEKMLRGFTLESSGPVTLGPVEGMACVYRLRVGPMTARMLCYLVVHGKKYYVITCSATEATFDYYKGTFSGIAKSFRLD